MRKPTWTELPDHGALEELFRDLPATDVHRSLHGVRFDVTHQGAEGFLAASAAAGILAGAFAEKLRTRPAGTYARIWYPRPAGIDLVVSPRKDGAPTGFAACYHVEALVPKLASRFLGAALPPLLTRLWSHYHVEMHDEYLEVGPLVDTPRESAQVMHTLISALLVPPEQPTVELSEDGRPLDSFCFYCGAPVAAITQTCPHCDGDLS